MMSITIKIILVEPPAGVDFAIQMGKGHVYSLAQKQRSKGSDLNFDCMVEVKKNSKGETVFRGDVVQGPSSAQFMYINIGTSAGQMDSVWTRRLKIPLTGITTELIDQIDEDSYLETHVPGKGKDGTPNCASVKNFEGWKIRRK
jgi:hypothetical protein